MRPSTDARGNSIGFHDSTLSQTQEIYRRGNTIHSMTVYVNMAVYVKVSSSLEIRNRCLCASKISLIHEILFWAKNYCLSMYTITIDEDGIKIRSLILTICVFCSLKRLETRRESIRSRIFSRVFHCRCITPISRDNSNSTIEFINFCNPRGCICASYKKKIIAFWPRDSREVNEAIWCESPQFYSAERLKILNPVLPHARRTLDELHDLKLCICTRTDTVVFNIFSNISSREISRNLTKFIDFPSTPIDHVCDSGCFALIPPFGRAV